ncbi:unnamed protein product [Enterobius vermicularis]|uniref:Uncharacterized protein n=1 Tax=Enterobius vermicularis TaxID=51028 RepID=A0A0N4V1N3_ENTVE|nr:unnamed protein product [Enterobius vermicularis]
MATEDADEVHFNGLDVLKISVAIVCIPKIFNTRIHSLSASPVTALRTVISVTLSAHRRKWLTQGLLQLSLTGETKLDDAT